MNPMTILGKFLTVVLFSLFTAQSTADIISVNIRSHNKAIIRFSKFEFSNTGYVSIAVSSVGISSIPLTSNSSQPDPSRMSFFLLSTELSDRYRFQFKHYPDLCALDIDFITVLFTFRDLSESSFNKSYHVVFPGEYSLYFANCNDLSRVTMDVRTELYNTDNDGTIKDYLSADQYQPSSYFNFFIIYACILGLWIMLCFMRQHERIHSLIGVLLVVTLLHLICAAVDQHDLKVTGTHHECHVLYYISQLMRNVLFFTVIVLIGAGPCNRRFIPAISVLMIVILLQVWVNVSCIMGEESGIYSEKLVLKAIYIFIDIICCLVVFFHNLISYCRRYFRDHKYLDDVLGKIFGWSIFSVIMIVFREMTEETGNLVFTMAMFCMYMPFVLDGKDQKGAGILLKDKDKKMSA